MKGGNEMANGRTRVEYDGCAKCVNEISKQIDVLINAAKSINSTMGELSNYWEGQSHDAAQEEYDCNYRKQLTETVPNAVESFRAYINKCHEKIKEADRALSGH